MKKFKLLHTADWHLGVNLENVDLKDEHDNFFEQLGDIVKSEQPNALLVSGDIFDSPNPASTVHDYLIEQLKHLHEAATDMEIVVIAGNHDSANRLIIAHQLTPLIKTHLIGRLSQNEDHNANYSDQILTLTYADGEPAALVAAVPYTNRMCYPHIGKEASYEERQVAYFKGLGEELVSSNQHNLPTVLMGHLTIATQGDTEAPEEVGNIESVDSNLFGNYYDYIALGHLHHPHHVDGHNGKINYSGSPIAVSFDEDYQHSVCLAEFEGHTITRQERVTIKPLHQLVTFPKQKSKEATFADFSEALADLKNYKESGNYIRLNIYCNHLPADYRKQAEEAVQSTGNTLLKINPKARAVQNAGHQMSLSVEEFKNVRPIKLALNYLESKGEELSQEEKDCLQQCISQIENQNRNY